MGIILSFFSRAPVVAVVSLHDAMQRALDEMRESRRILKARTDNKRRRIRDVDTNMVEIGLRMQNSNNRLCEVDAQSFRLELRQKRLLVKSHGQFCQQLSNLDAQIMMLEDSPALEQSLESLRAGVGVHSDAVRNTQSLLADVRASMASLYDRSAQQAAHDEVDRLLTGMDDDALCDELNSLMHNDEFLGQFDKDELERARLAMLATAPRAPTHAPSAPRDSAHIEREAGLVAAT